MKMNNCRFLSKRKVVLKRVPLIQKSVVLICNKEKRITCLLLNTKITTFYLNFAFNRLKCRYADRADVTEEMGDLPCYSIYSVWSGHGNGNSQLALFLYKIFRFHFVVSCAIIVPSRTFFDLPMRLQVLYEWKSLSDWKGTFPDQNSNRKCFDVVNEKRSLFVSSRK